MNDLDRVLLQNLRITAQVLTEVCQRNTRLQVCPVPLSRNQYYILNILAKSGDFPISELARILEISTAAASKNIDRLEQLEFVKRRPSASDRRASNVELLPYGRSIVEEFDRVTAVKQQPVLDDFTDEEKQQLLGLLRRVVRNTLHDQHMSELICLQCAGNCGEECAVESCRGNCRAPRGNNQEGAGSGR